jgi:Tfp pilus assembly ATPase PilU
MQDYERAKNENDIVSISDMLPYISEQVRSFLSLREVGQIRVAKTPYKRGRR